MEEQSYDPVVPVKVENSRASEQERPRDPLEGRGKQGDVSVEGNISETQNSRNYVHANRQIN